MQKQSHDKLLQTLFGTFHITFRNDSFPGIISRNLEERRIEIKDLKHCLVQDSKSADDTIEHNMILLISDF